RPPRQRGQESGRRERAAAWASSAQGCRLTGAGKGEIGCVAREFAAKFPHYPMTSRISFLALFGLMVTTLFAGAPVPRAKPEEVGLSTERLRRVTELVTRLQAEPRIAGAVTLVARRGKVAHLEAQGFSNLETKRALKI